VAHGVEQRSTGHAVEIAGEAMVTIDPSDSAST